MVSFIYVLRCSRIWSLEKILKKIVQFFYIKNKDYSYTVAMGYLVHGEMFENVLQLMCFIVYFERVLNTN